MKTLLTMSAAERAEFALSMPETVPVFVHPLYEYLRRERPVGGPRVSVPTTPDAPAKYTRLYRAMPEVSFDGYLPQLQSVASAATHAIIFEEVDRVAHLWWLLQELPWNNVLLVPTNIGNAVPLDLPGKAGSEQWHPDLWDALVQVGVKKARVYGGGFMPLPEPACAGTVLLFLLGMECMGAIQEARPGDSAVLRA